MFDHLLRRWGRTRQLSLINHIARPTNVPDNTISTLSQLLCDGVSLVDNEVLVEDLKDLPSLKIRHGVESLREEEEEDVRVMRLEGIYARESGVKVSSFVW